MGKQKGNQIVFGINVRNLHILRKEQNNLGYCGTNIFVKIHCHLSCLLASTVIKLFMKLRTYYLWSTTRHSFKNEWEEQ